MKIGIIAPKERVDGWVRTFKKYDEKIHISAYPDIDYDKIDCICLWKHPKDVLGKFNNLKLIHSMGAGVDHIIKDNIIDYEIPIVRIVDPFMAKSMSHWVVMSILNYIRDTFGYYKQQKNKI